MHKDVISTRHIASLRIHVQRAIIRRINIILLGSVMSLTVANEIASKSTTQAYTI